MDDNVPYRYEKSRTGTRAVPSVKTKIAPIAVTPAATVVLIGRCGLLVPAIQAAIVLLIGGE